MKCPLRSALIDLEGVTDFENILPCLKEECAWWYIDGARCSIHDVCLTLNMIEETLSDIRDYMEKRRTP